jgi:predicted Rossmann-fold nucleotide-binding protein
VQTKKIRKIPIVLFGKSYWEPLIAFFQQVLYEKHHAIDEADLSLFHVVDTVDEAYDYIVANVTC